MHDIPPAAKRVRQVQAELNRVTREAGERYLAEQPDRAGLLLWNKGNVSRKPPNGYGEAIAQLACNLIANYGFRQKTNEELVAWLQKSFLHFPIGIGVMTKPLSAKQLSQVQSTLTEHGKPLSLPDRVTASQLKMALRAMDKGQRAEIAGTSRSYDAKVTFTDAEVIIDGRVLKIGSAGRITTAGGKIKVATLATLFTGSPKAA